MHVSIFFYSALCQFAVWFVVLYFNAISWIPVGFWKVCNSYPNRPLAPNDLLFFLPCRVRVGEMFNPHPSSWGTPVLAEGTKLISYSTFYICACIIHSFVHSFIRPFTHSFIIHSFHQYTITNHNPYLLRSFGWRCKPCARCYNSLPTVVPLSGARGFLSGSVPRGTHRKNPSQERHSNFNRRCFWVYGELYFW